MLHRQHILLLLDRLKWEPVYEDSGVVLAKKRAGGYSDDPVIGAIEAALSIELEVCERAKHGRQ